MPSLKDIKNRIGSVKNTQKITKAMKMVAAAKLRKSQERAENSRPYSAKIQQVINNILQNLEESARPELLTGRKSTSEEIIKEKILLIATSSDRGLCGGFNTNLVRATKAKVDEYLALGKEVKIVTVGKKARDILRTAYKAHIVASYEAAKGKQVEFNEASEVGKLALDMFEKGDIDSAELIYAEFVNPLVQKVTVKSLIPLEIHEDSGAIEQLDTANATYEYEPDEESILNNLLPNNISVQIFMGLLENSASEQGARMTAMDSATKNAGEMIKKLTLQYNRSRQAAITKELIEIISGAEAV